MPFTYEINGQGVEFEREPTEVDIDEAAAQLGGQQTQQEGITVAQFPERQPEGDLGLNVLGKIALRGKLAFGDEPAQVKSFLEQRFPGRKVRRIKDRKFSIDGIPIDPEGLSISDLPLDIIDISDEIVRIGGQIFGAIKGAAIGAPAGPIGAGAGAIAGGATGRAGGEAATEAIGRFFGVQGGEGIGEVAKDIAREGAIGAAGESLGLGLRAISRPTGQFLRTFFKKLARSGRTGEQVLLNFTGGMQRSSIARLQRLGAKVLTDENLSDDALLRVGQKIQKAALKAKTKLQRAVESGRGIIRNIHKKTIDITDIKTDYARKLQSVGLLNRNFEQIKPSIGKLDVGQKELVNIFNILRKQKKISPAKALQWRTELDRIIKFSQVGKFVTTDAENAIAMGLRSQLRQKLIDVSDDFAKANADFTNFSRITEMLKGKLDTQRVENFLKTTFSGQHIFEESLGKLNQVVGPEDTFMQPLRNVLAARDFASTTFRGIRTGIISGILGSLGFVTGGAAGAAQSIAAGVILSTPRLAGRAILVRQATSRTLQALLKRASQRATTATPKAISSLLSNLLKEKK